MNIFRVAFYLFFLSLFAQKIQAQNQKISPTDSLQMRGMIDRARTLILQEIDMERGAAILDSVEILLKKYPTENSEIHALYWQYRGGYAYNKADWGNTARLFGRALSVFEKIYPPNDLKLASNNHNLGMVYNNYARYDSALYFMHKSLKIRELNDENPDFEKAGTLNIIGIVHYNLGDFSQANYYYQAALTMYENFPEAQLSRSMVYLNLGNVHDDWGDVAKSIEYYQHCLSIRRVILPPTHIRIARVLGLLTISYLNQGELKKAEIAALEAMKINKDLMEKDTYELAQCMESYALVLGEFGRLEEAIATQHKVIALMESVDWMSPREKAAGKNSLARFYLLKKDFPACIAQSEQAIKEFNKIFKNKPNPHLMDAVALTAAAYIEMKMPEKALTICDEMLAKFEKEDPNGQKLAHYYQTLLGWRATALFDLAKKEPTNLQNCLTAFQTFDAVFQQNARRVKRESSLSSNLKIARKFYEKAIEAHYFAYSKNGNLEDVAAAFYYSEQGRSIRLKLAAGEINAKQFAGVPDSVLNEDTRLKAQIANAETEILDLQEAEILDKIAVFAADQKLQNLNKEQEFLLQNIKKNHPAYFQYKYEVETESIADIQKSLLDTDQTLLEYFVGDSNIYVFRIGKNDFELQKISKDFPLETWVSEQRSAITAFHTDPNMTFKYDSLSSAWTDKSQILYQKLLAPMAAKLTERLLIIPDGVLGYLPFEALISEPITARADRWNLHKYLIINYSVTYCPSATMLREMNFRKLKNTNSTPFFGFAPHFTGDTTQLAGLFHDMPDLRKELSPLPFSGEEVAIISNLLGGKYLTGEEATIENFLKNASNSSILHLATHGQANDQNGDYCFLVFSKNSAKSKVQNPKSEILFARDIYNISLDADLVTLSACETGIGQLQNGEGIISLARAFAYAGAKNIVTSLWAVSDAKTKDLMIDFYKNMKKGKTKDEALRQAKLDFLSKNKGQTAHPFFWAGFIGIGAMK